MLLLFLFEKSIITIPAVLFKNVAFENLERDEYNSKYIPPPISIYIN